MRRVSSGLAVLAAAVTPVAAAFTVSATGPAPTTSAPSTAGAPAVTVLVTVAPAGPAPAIGPIEIGLAKVVVIGPAATAAGDRPTFSWEPVERAARYTLAVLTGANEPLWAWDGTATSVILGGWPSAPPADAPGPLLIGPGAWFVVAYDAAGAPLAVSDVLAVSPA